MRLEGKVVLLAGASRGIGAALALELARKGAKCILLARSKEKLQNLAASIAQQGFAMPEVAPADLTDPVQMSAVIAGLQSKYPVLDLLLYNAGIGQWSTFEETSAEAARQIMELNFFAAVFCIQKAIPWMRPANGARIALVSSVAGLRGMPMGSVYSASKFALDGLADALRIELAKDKIRVTVVYPSLTKTDFFNHLAAGSMPSVRGKWAQSPEVCASRVIRAIEKDRRTSILSTKGKLIALAHRWAPWLLDWMKSRKSS